MTETNFTNLIAGEYEVEITDAKDCFTELNFTIGTMSCDSLDTTSLIPELCNTGDVLMTNFLEVSEVDNAESYLWLFTPEYTNTPEVEIITDENTFIPSNNEALIPNEFYAIQVKALNAAIPSDYGAACTLRFILPAPSLLLDNCADATKTWGQLISAEEFSGTDNYEFRFENADGERIYLYSGGTNTAVIDPASGLLENTPYLVNARLNINGIWGPYGNTCTVQIIEPLPTTALTDEWCGNLSIDPEIISIDLQPIDEVSVYEVKLESENGEVIIFTSEDPVIFVAEIEEAFMEGEIDVQVRVQINGNWSEYGPVCTIGFFENLLKLNMIVFPVPALTNEQIHMRMEGNWENVNLEVFDLSGRPMMQEKRNFTHGEDVLMEVPEMKPGVYLLKVQHGKQSLTERFILQ
jgi:hypothetical protein